MNEREGEQPPLPPGRHVSLAGRGTTFIRESPGPSGAASVVLLHGWTVTADLNWFTSYGTVGRHHRVVAPDLRGHGRGPRSRRPFRLEEAADDVAALTKVVGLAPPVVLVGYSMGGAVAQLVVRRHPRLADGLVLCATSTRFTDGDIGDRILLAGILGLSLASRVAPPALSRSVADTLMRRRVEGTRMADWALTELARNDATALIEAGAALRMFDSSSWSADLDLPSAVVVTTRDQVVDEQRQRELAGSLASCSLHRVDGDHGVCVNDPTRFLPVLLDAIESVLGRGRPATTSGAEPPHLHPQASSTRRAAATTASE
jgi:pimeloyl-ACP methyl ester carboxylesterase